MAGGLSASDELQAAAEWTLHEKPAPGAGTGTGQLPRFFWKAKPQQKQPKDSFTDCQDFPIPPECSAGGTRHGQGSGRVFHCNDHERYRSDCCNHLAFGDDVSTGRVN